MKHSAVSPKLDNPFNSFLMGGFECSTHCNSSGEQLDMIAATRHDEFALADYERLTNLGILTARDGLRWHLIEREPFRYDFSSAADQVKAAKASGIQIIWDYFHYGYPHDIDIFTAEFVERFAAFSYAATEYLRCELGGDLIVCPVNEISFFSWTAGEKGLFYPYAIGRGDLLKRNLVRSTIAGIDAAVEAAPAVRWMMTDPAIHVVPRGTSPEEIASAAGYRDAQFHAFDMIAGRRFPELGGAERYLDIIGLNYYVHNQWFDPDREPLPPDHPEYLPLRSILSEYKLRYDRPMIIAETGIEDDLRPAWYRGVRGEVDAFSRTTDGLHGLCLYPVVNHPGWEDARHCHNGLWDYADDTGFREIYQPLRSEIFPIAAEAHA